MSQRKAKLIETLTFYGLKLSGNKDELQNRLDRHLEGKGSEYSRRGVPKRERDEPVSFAESAPKHAWNNSEEKRLVIQIQNYPKEIWQIIFYFAGGYEEWLCIRLVCKYFHGPATALLMRMSKEWIGIEDMALFGFLSILDKDSNKPDFKLRMRMNSILQIRFSVPLNDGNEFRSCTVLEICQQVCAKFKTLASAKEKWLSVERQRLESVTKRRKTLSVKKEHEKILNDWLKSLGLSAVKFSVGSFATPAWFKDIAFKIQTRKNRPNFTSYHLYEALSKYLKNGLETDVVEEFFEMVMQESVETLKK